MPEKTNEAISSFSCARDRDIENFLKKRSVKFEDLAKARTYLLLDKRMIQDEQKIDILAYFSIAPKVLELPEDLSTRQRKELDGFSGKMNHESITVLPMILIGQLAKNDKYLHEITGDTIMEYVFSIIQSIHNMLGGRIVSVDVRKNADGLIRFYKKYDFKESKKNQDGDLIQMIRMLC